MQDLPTIRMLNQLSFTRPDNPSVPLYPAGEEVILVSVMNDILRISDTGLLDSPGNRVPYVSGAFEGLGNFAANLRIYGQFVREDKGTFRFLLLRDPVQPDEMPFPVLQTPAPVCHLIKKDGLWELYAAGVDDGDSGKPRVIPSNERGWIFTAREIGGDSDQPAGRSQARAQESFFALKTMTSPDNFIEVLSQASGPGKARLRVPSR